ncbi:hypothetical protein L3Q72_19545 [Vibrio sp. JC009]|uniref:hypothetical protein n=1 Tax=Vibrio sp. JC009 TaxID=2912314 RepID=UPI0023B1D4AA|nr:hypothetical protein [Vibrio sp. JC009]WED23436.1 hypothetical protein L3Q72_19545 [Vibrio sp. JC009]
MGSEEADYARWKVRAKIMGFATWLGLALAIAAVVATYLAPDVSNTARLAGFLFIIINALASPAWLYLFVRTRLELKAAKERYEQSQNPPG